MKGEPWLVLGDSNKVGTSHPLWPIRHMVTGLLRFQQHGGSVQLWGQNQRSLRGDKTPFGPSGRGWLIYISPEAGSRVYAERPLHRALWMTYPLWGTDGQRLFVVVPLPASEGVLRRHQQRWRGPDDDGTKRCPTPPKGQRKKNHTHKIWND